MMFSKAWRWEFPARQQRDGLISSERSTPTMPLAAGETEGVGRRQV